VNYEEIKLLAKEMKRPVTRLIALAPNNDPFYVGTPTDKLWGAWFRDLWHEFRYTTGVHIRRMHYAIVSQNPPVKMPDGTPYENTESCWKKLTEAAKAARYLEYVDPAAFVDRRNDDPVVWIDPDNKQEAEFSVTSGAYEDEWGNEQEIALPELPVHPAYSLDRFHAPQRYHLEVWCEKSTMNDILVPLIRDYRAALVFGKGELSITAALAAIERFRTSKKPVRIFYVSDFDPAGAGMPVSMARKLEYFLRNMDLELDVKLYPVVLTYEQTQHYTKLLPTPIKDSEKRKASFEARYGGGAIELDALEALYPRELSRILRKELERYYDYALSSNRHDAEEEAGKYLEDIQTDILKPYELEIEEMETEWQTISDEFEGRIADYRERRKTLWRAIENALEDNKPENMDDTLEEYLPEAAYADEKPDALFDSSRDYLTQNDAYQVHKGNEIDEVQIA
jgi:hypothetical protein